MLVLFKIILNFLVETTLKNVLTPLMTHTQTHFCVEYFVSILISSKSVLFTYEASSDKSTLIIKSAESHEICEYIPKKVIIGKIPIKTVIRYCIRDSIRG